MGGAVYLYIASPLCIHDFMIDAINQIRIRCFLQKIPFFRFCIGRYR